MGGKSKPPEPTITQAPTKTPEQTQFLSSLLGMMGGFMGPESFGTMPTLGERYTGGRPAPGGMMGAPSGGKGGGAPTGRPEGERRGRGSPLDATLTGPFVNPYREGMTGNFQRGRGGRR